MTERPKRFVFFYRNFKYTGTLIGEDSTHFYIDDIKEGKIRLPKSETLVKEEVNE